MNTNRIGKYIFTTLVVELSVLVFISLFAYLFWSAVCEDTWQSCLGQKGALKWFFVFGFIRPVIFTPFFVLVKLGAEAFGPIWGPMLASAAAIVSCLLVYAPANYLGRRMVTPWLSKNLPYTFSNVRRHADSIAFFLRLIPIVPFDLASFIFGVLNLRLKNVLISGFFGSLGPAYLFTYISYSENGLSLAAIPVLLSYIGACVGIGLLLMFISNEDGRIWGRFRRIYGEIKYEVRVNNDIYKRYKYDANKPPVILLYGFFSSRRALIILERRLVSAGHQVMTFNLGGLLGVFFTRGIIEASEFVKSKIDRQLERHRFPGFYIIGHSKGGLVGLWYLLKLGGSKYCRAMITMGTPYKGSWLTYLAIPSPLGFFWRDIWQMRPGSEFLERVKDLKIPSHLKIYCIHSKKDYVCRGPGGVYRPYETAEQVNSIAFDEVSHFEYLTKRDVTDKIVEILKYEEQKRLTPVIPETPDEKSSAEAQIQTGS